MTRTGLSVLSFDAGGPRCISQLHILVDMMEKVSLNVRTDANDVIKRPCDVFDVIGGVGTGGLIAILLVIFKLTAKEALDEFTNFAIDVFKDAVQNPTQQTAKLQRSLKEILDKHGIDKDAKLISATGSPSTCKLVLPVMHKNHVGVPCVLRNYVVSREPPTNLTIIEAMLATCATPPTFAPVMVSKEFATFEYVSGDVGLSNPIREVLAEAHRAYGDEATVACLLSIGCGHPGVIQVPKDSGSTARLEFLEQLAMDSETTAREMQAQMSDLSLYYRLSVIYGLDLSQNLRWKEPEAIGVQTAAYLADVEVGEEIARCVDKINDGDGFTTLEQLTKSGGAKILPPPLPPLTPNYVERQAPMEFIEKALFEEGGSVKPGSKLILVTGIGGCGKTQLTRKVLDKHRLRFVSTFYIDGSSRGTLRRDILRNVRALGTAHSQKSFEESMTFLSQQPLDGERLLIIDNLDDPSLDLAPFLPKWTSGVVIITSRNYSRGQLSPEAHLQLDVMSLDQSIELIARGSGERWPPSVAYQETAATVAKELGYLPIAIVQAISYMYNTGCSAETYISRLRSNRERVLRNPATSQLDMRYKTAFAAFDASFDILPSRAQRVFLLLSLFHWRDFPLELVILAAEDGFSAIRINEMPEGDDFELGKERLKEMIYRSDQWDPVDLDETIATLRNHSLINIDHVFATTLIQKHLLVHEWARLRISDTDMKPLHAAAVRLLCCGATDKNRNMMQYLFSHVQALSSTWESLHANDASAFCFILQEAGLHRDGGRLAEIALNKSSNEFGPEHLGTMKASSYLAVTHSRLGRYAEAERLQSKVLETRTRLQGPDHPETLFASGYLASTYSNQGRYAEAEVLQRDILSRCERLYGEDSPDTILASGELALTYSSLGRYGDAEALEKEVLRRRTKLFGPDHHDTTIAAGNLAETYQKLGRYNEAAEIKVEVLRQRKRVFGEDNPLTIEASLKLAVNYIRTGLYSEAEVLAKEVLEKRIRLFGIDGPDTITASQCLAIVYGRLGRHSEAEVLELQILQQLTRLLGAEHPETIDVSASLAVTYSELGRYSEAAALEEEVLKQRKTLLGPDHPLTLDAIGNLATTYEQLGRYEESVKMQKEVLEQRKRVLGEDHPETMDATTNLAVTYGSLGRYADAEKLEVEVLKRRKRILGSNHPHTILAAANLSTTYARMGRLAEAEPLQLEVIKQRREVLGENHPLTISAISNLANTYGLLKRHPESEAMKLDVIKRNTTVLGETHPDTLRAILSLARTYRETHRRPEGKKLAENTRKIALDTLGEDSPLYKDADELVAAFMIPSWLDPVLVAVARLIL